MTIQVTQTDIDNSSQGPLNNSLATAINRLYPTWTAQAFVDVQYLPFPARAIIQGVHFTIDNLPAITAVALQNLLGSKPSAPYEADLTEITI